MMMTMQCGVASDDGGGILATRLTQLKHARVEPSADELRAFVHLDE